MKELRLTIISDDKRVEIHVVDADAVLGAINKNTTHPLSYGAGELADLIKTAVAKCADSDKIEIGPEGATHNKADGSKVTFAL